MGPKSKSRVTITSEGGRRERLPAGVQAASSAAPLLSLRGRRPLSGAPFPFSPRSPLPPVPTPPQRPTSPSLAPKRHAPSRRTGCPQPHPAAASAPPSEQPPRAARGAPTPPGREPGHPSSEAGTAAPGPSHRKPPPPGARAAPPPRPPRAAATPGLPRTPARRTPSARAHYLPRGYRSGAQLLSHFRLPAPALGPGHVAARGHLTRKRLAGPQVWGNRDPAWDPLPGRRQSYPLRVYFFYFLFFNFFLCAFKSRSFSHSPECSLPSDQTRTH